MMEGIATDAGTTTGTPGSERGFFSEAELRKIDTLLRSGMPCNQVVKEMGVIPTTFYWRLKRQGKRIEYVEPPTRCLADIPTDL